MVCIDDNAGVPDGDLDDSIEPGLRMDWTLDFETREGEFVSLSREDCEALLQRLMHHRLLTVEVEIPDGIDADEMLFGTGNAVALSYDREDSITVCIPAGDNIGWHPRQKEDKPSDGE